MLTASRLDRQVKLVADHLGDLLERHALIRDRVVNGFRRALLDHEPIEACGIQSVYAERFRPSLR